MPRKIEATVTPELFNALKAEAKRRGLRLHAVAGALLAERLTLEAAPTVPETPSIAKAPRRRRRKTPDTGSSVPTTSSRGNEPAPDTSDT